MRQQIIIHLGKSCHAGLDVEQVSWIVLGDETPKASVYQGDLHTAANHATGCRVIVMVSAFDVLLTEVDLPAMNRQRLIKAVPFALEEQVAADVDDLHFAIGQREDNQELTCAVVERDITDAWLKTLRDAGIQVDVLTTEFFGVQLESDGSWSIVIDNMSGDPDKVLLRTGQQTGLAVDMANVLVVLRTMLESLEPDQRPNEIHLTTCEEPIRTQRLVSDTEANIIKQDLTEELDEAPTLIASVNEQNFTPFLDSLRELCDEFLMELVVNHQEDPYLAYLSRQFDEKKCINLLQGEYSRIEQLGKIFKPWIAPAAIVSIWLILTMGLMLANYFDLSSKDSSLRAEVESIYREAFPDTKNVVNAQVQMQRGLDKLRNGDDDKGDMFPILSKAGLVMHNTDTLILRSLRFKNEKLDIDFEIGDLQKLDDLKARMVKDTGMKVEILSATARDGKVEGRIQLKPKK